MPYSETLYDLFKSELLQLQEEGCIPDELAKEYSAISPDDPDKEKKATKLWKQSVKLRPDKGFPFKEPSDLEGIQNKRPRGIRRFPGLPSDAELKNRIYGAWLGRCAGCILGKPVEPLGHNREIMLDVLRQNNAYPISDYLPQLILGIPDTIPYHNWKEELIPCSKGNITAAERDDDLDYVVLALHYLEKFGPNFKPADVALTWLNKLPYHRVYTAERVAYYNFALNIEPPESALFQNPYREWIGAQIRGDGFGYMAPGWPEKAAELAFRDASISHVKNGIYGEMLMAGIISAALVSNTIDKAIDTGLTEIPATSRLYKAVEQVRAWVKNDQDPAQTIQRIHTEYGHYNWVHTINNAAVVIMAISYAKDDYEKAITLAVDGGWDTDCNGATAGSIMGALLGAEVLPSKWIAPLNDTLKSDVVGFYSNKISDLAERTFIQAKRIIS